MNKIVEELLPPDLPRVTRYRLAVTVSILVLMILSLIGFVGLPFLGLTRFARAGELDEHTKDVTILIESIERKLKDIRIDLLEQRMYDAKKESCQFKTPDTSQALRFYSRQIAVMHREYYETTKRNFQIPTCEEVGS